MNTNEFADDILESIIFAINAHIHNPKTPNDKIRYWDRYTPYIIHPTWCAMTILTETTLSLELRKNGYQALLWHDVLEDTLLDLPDSTTPTVRKLVNEMTFISFQDEIREIWNRDNEVQLLKLYDKTSNILDGTWMSHDKHDQYTNFTLRLADNVYKNYGLLNIVKIAKAICS